MKRIVWSLVRAILPLSLGATLLFGLPVLAAPTQAQQDAIRSSCQSDYRSYCASVPTGGSAALECLQKNVASLSPSCQQAVNAATGAAAAPAGGTAPATTTTPADDHRSRGDTGARTGSGTDGGDRAQPARGTGDHARGLRPRLHRPLRRCPHHRRRRAPMPRRARLVPLRQLQGCARQARPKVLAWDCWRVAGPDGAGRASQGALGGAYLAERGPGRG